MDNSEHNDLEAGGVPKAFDAEARSLEVRRQLDRANAEFEEFVSMTVHNLRQSLRDVTAFSQLLAESHAGQLDSEGAAFLRRIRSGAEEMESMLVAVVDYWATAGGEPPSSRTDMQAVLCQALLHAKQQIAEQKAVITHDRLPWVGGDFETLAKVLHHLIRNAIEYCPVSPRIHISSRRVDAEWVFSVKDNGPGIESAFHDRIFGAFKRLHGKEHPGNGLGLAFCKKAVEWHGGRIWVESTPGEGTTFYFALPEAD